MAKSLTIILLLALAGFGCQRWLVRTDSSVRIDGPVETKLVSEPVSSVGPLRAIAVQGPPCGPRIAIVDVDGLILNTPFVGFSSLGENPVAIFREKLDAAGNDPLVKAVVLRINSPGGGVAACQTMRAELLRFKSHKNKPVIACLLDSGTGGAYYLATAADGIVAGPATVTGGVGVILNLYNLRDLMAQFNILPQPVKSGEMVDVGTSAKALNPEEKKILQGAADELHMILKSDIIRTRPNTDLGMGTTFDGRIFTATQARDRAMIDYIGDLHSAIEIAASVAGKADAKCDGMGYQVVLYRRSNDPAHSIYAVSANVPLQGAGLLPNVPGLDRAKLPTFLSLWQPEMTMEKLGGK